MTGQYWPYELDSLDGGNIWNDIISFDSTSQFSIWGITRTLGT